MTRTGTGPVRFFSALALGLLCLSQLVACGDDDDGDPPGTPAQQRGVGDECATDADCLAGAGLTCLAFKGGYCGVKGCTAHEDCPAGSGCVVHDDGSNYCFLTCTDKVQCNYYRTLDNEANCSSKVSWLGDDQGKACVPPSG